MNIQTLVFMILATVLCFVLFRTKRKVRRTTKLGLKFYKENKQYMGAPLTATFQAPDTLQVTITPELASGAASKGVLSNVTATSSDLTIFTPSTDSNNVITLNAQAAATATGTLTVAATVTDPDGVASNLTVVATITVTVDVSGERTVSLGLAFTTVTPAS